MFCGDKVNSLYDVCCEVLQSDITEKKFKDVIWGFDKSDVIIYLLSYPSKLAAEDSLTRPDN